MIFKNKKNETVDEITQIHKSLETLANHIAIIVDNEVVDVIHCDEKLGAMLLSDPTFISISAPSEKSPTTGWSYIDGKFIHRVSKKEPAVPVEDDYHVE
jgi:hypothetical protein